MITLTETLIILLYYPIIVLLLHFKWEKPKTKSNNCFIIDFKPKIINMARKTIKNKPRRLNMQITELSVSPVTMHKTTAIYRVYQKKGNPTLKYSSAFII